ncbi:MAG: recombinase family protein, partial [candidate division Zixibacteria bacterium]|nr:recombinase family protein [candidate division Zixibacteria bacterium]
GDFDVLVCREMDRLARSLAKQMIVEDRLKRAGVVIEYALASYDDTPEGQLQKLVRASVAEYERLKIVERMERGRRRAVQRGNVLVAGQAPYGYYV